jgi:hypothetical protein
MTPEKLIKTLQSKFDGINTSKQIALKVKNKYFNATLREDGIDVDNLQSQKFLPWSIFTETYQLLSKSISELGVKKGSAMNAKLGTPKLPLDSIEGHIAHSVYKKKEGQSVFRRISPIAAILAWASIVENNRGYLKLL